MNDRQEPLDAVTQWLESEDSPFTYFMAGVDDGRLELHVPHGQVNAVIAHFDKHPVVLPDATVLPVSVTGMAGESWISEPNRRTGWRPDPLPPADLLGLDVREAALRANDGGWLVRAHEPEAILTADRNMGRMNLCYSDGIVIDASIG